LDAAAVRALRGEMAEGNMDAVPLEKAPRIAVYTPPDAPPWDDAVTLALTYAGIPYDAIWDDAVLDTDLSTYDWIHLHHEDFTGQQHKLASVYRDAPWFVRSRERDLAMARRFGHADIPALKKAVRGSARRLRLAGGVPLRDVRIDRDVGTRARGSRCRYRRRRRLMDRHRLDCAQISRHL